MLRQDERVQSKKLMDTISTIASIMAPAWPGSFDLYCIMLVLVYLDTMKEYGK